MSAPVTPCYPFSAVVGQETLKLALILCAIDPSIGGVLLQGPRGMAKTTLARALSELVSGPFVELPLGASEERVTGSLNLGRALRDAQVEFEPGLLARAHEGVLYVDEVNLLPDSLVDLLLDASATGQNLIERDGISHAHPARFVLVGSMNPDEGELRPQLTDRFGLSVNALGRVVPDERMQIVARRLDFERFPARFRDEYAREQRALSERCARARALSTDIPLQSALERVAERCYAAGVEGVRADLAMLRAARAHAAWHARGRITEDDIDAVAELALGHRRPSRTDSEPNRGESGPASSAGGRASGSAPGAGHDRGSSTTAHAREHDAAAPGERGTLPARPVRADSPPRMPPALFGRASQRTREPWRRGKPRQAARSGARASGRAALGALDWFATLLTGPARREARYRARRRPARELLIVLVDCSSSMVRSGGLAAAKGVARALELAARSTGAHVALISFRGDTAELALGRSAGSNLETVIAELGGGGGTPLRKALSLAGAVCRRTRFSGSALVRRLVLLSDGRSRESLAGALHQKPDLERIVIDCERGRLRLGRAHALATAIGARWLHVDSLSNSN
jgi:magnesium chelatase subunit D